MFTVWFFEKSKNLHRYHGFMPRVSIQGQGGGEKTWQIPGFSIILKRGTPEVVKLNG